MLKSNLACIIVSYNIGYDIHKCYNAIKDQVDRVIIVDNGSNKETIQALKQIEENKKTDIIFLDKNQGIAKALNEGVILARNKKYKWIITMDNDSEATKDMVCNMISVYNELPVDEKKDIVSIAPIFIDISDNEENLKQNLDIKYSYVDLVITSGNIISLDIFNKIGMFREDYFIDYVDNEFCLRILESGKKIIQINQAILKHHLGNSLEKKIFFKTIKSTNHSPVRRYYLTRNSLDVANKYNHLGIRHINNTKRVLFRFMLEILLVEDNKINKIKYMYKGYKDYKSKIFGEFKSL